MKTNNIKPPGYESKPGSYYAQSRGEMIRFVPEHCQRVLDVGCGKGNFGEALKRERNIEVWGVEPVAAAAAEAATKLDHVIEGIFAPETGLPAESFDAIIFNDVLEHLVDPFTALKYARTLLKSEGVIVASVPNIRHFQALWEIVVRGGWLFHDSGIFDRTHVHFFTKKSIPDVFGECGLMVEKLEGINSYWWLENWGGPPRWLVFKVLNVLTLNAIEDMKYLQFATVARVQKKSS